MNNGLKGTSVKINSDANMREQMEERYRLLVECAPLGISSIDPQGNILYANDTLLTILDLSSDEAKSPINILSFPPMVKAGIDNDIRQCIDTGSMVISERPYTGQQGKDTYLQLHLTPVRDGQERIAMVQMIVEDVTARKQSEETLRNRQRQLVEQNKELQRLSQAVEQSANTVVITDLEGNIEYVNPRFEETTGYTAEEVLGQNSRILKSSEQSNAFYKELWETITSGQEWHGEFHNKRKNGTLYWEQATIAPIYDARGQMTHFIAVKEDITARQETEEALQRNAERLKTLHEIYQSILAARLPETIAVAAIHRLRQLIPCRRAVAMAIEDNERITLLAADSDSGFAPATDIDVYQEIGREENLKHGHVQGADDLTTLQRLSPMQRSLYRMGVRSYIAVPLFIEGDLVGSLNLESDQPQVFSADHIAIATEVAASLAVAIRQAWLYEKAQQELGERMQAEAKLRRYTTELEAQNAELDAFAHTVAHDLKNPLNSVIGYADVVARNYTTLPEETLQKFFQTIARNAHKMSSIIDELLLLSSVRELEKIETHPLEMGRIVAEVRGRLIHLIEELGGEIILPERWPVAVGYTPWIEEVWINYISNALKYGGRPPSVELGANPLPIQPTRHPVVKTAKQTTDQLTRQPMIRFWVRDNGPGLSAEEQVRLFTPFERLHRVHAEGHGLGLSIVQRIIHKLGGQVGVESADVPGQGSTFYFTLPALPVDQS